jgi:hypothetical protein
VDAYLAAEDGPSQQLLLEAPERALYRYNVNGPEAQGYDIRLSGYGNEVATAIHGAVAGMQDLLKLLDDPRVGSLQQTEQMLLSPGIELLTDGVVAIKHAACHLRIHKTQNKDER